IIESLLETADKVTIALTVDNDNLEHQDELDLFHQTKETYQSLKMLAKEMNIIEEEAVVLTNESSYLKDSHALLHLETNFDFLLTPEFKKEVNFNIEVAEAVHTRVEVEGVAQKILELVRDNNYRYNDLVIFMRDSSTYHSLIETVFSDYKIPVYIYEKKKMLNHPLIELTYLLFELLENDCSCLD